MLRKPGIYLDSAATALKPISVIEEITRYYTDFCAPVHRSIYRGAQEATEKYHKVRKKVQEFLNAPRIEEIIFTKGATEGINLVASCFPLQPGDEVMCFELEHHSNIVPWQLSCKKAGAKLIPFPALKSGEVNLEKFKELLSEKTRLVAIAHMSNVTGIRHPIEEIVRLAKKQGAAVLVDGAQAVTQSVVDVRDLGADFYVFSGHKLYGPTGVGVLWGRKEFLEEMPPFLGGGDMIDQVTFEKTTFQKLPLKFEAGTPPIAEVLGLGKALEFLMELGMEAIEAHDQKLFSWTYDELKRMNGVRVLGSAPERGAILSFVVEGVHHLDLGTFLDLEGVQVRTGHLCAQSAMRHFGIEGCSRASFALYNTQREAEQFVEALQKVVRELKCMSR